MFAHSPNGHRPAAGSAYAIQPAADTGALKATLLNDIRRSVYVYRVDCGGCNGCEIEIFASLTPLFDVERFGIKVVSSPRHADVLVYTGSMTRSMRVPALRAYHAAPDPKICVAYGACGCSGGIFHDLYCVWGGADVFIPIDVYIPGCPPTPAATIYGFAMALGMLGQKLKGAHHAAAGAPPVLPRHPEIPLAARVAVERAARRLAGYVYGSQIAETFFGLVAGSALPPGPAGMPERVAAYLEQQADPRLAEIMAELEAVYASSQEAV